MIFCSIIKDDKGLFSLFDGISAILLLFLALLAFNSLIYFESPNDDSTISDSKLVNDVMTLMITEKTDSYSTLYIISLALKNNNNNLDHTTRSYISDVAGDFLNRVIPNKNYVLIENNILDGEIIASKGYIGDNSNVSSSTRNLGDYSFTLSIF